MFDSCRRDIHYLRLSVTDRCNLRCRYCMPDGAKIPEHEEVLTHEEFLRLAALFAQCGIDTVRVTGGEPLVRKSVAQLGQNDGELGFIVLLTQFCKAQGELFFQSSRSFFSV